AKALAEPSEFPTHASRRTASYPSITGMSSPESHAVPEGRATRRCEPLADAALFVEPGSAPQQGSDAIRDEGVHHQRRGRALDSGHGKYSRGDAVEILGVPAGDLDEQVHVAVERVHGVDFRNVGEAGSHLGELPL